jgi:hypothetical protein
MGRSWLQPNSIDKINGSNRDLMTSPKHSEGTEQRLKPALL